MLSVSVSYKASFNLLVHELNLILNDALILLSNRLMVRLERLLLVELLKKHLDVQFLPLRITRHLLNRLHNALNALSLVGAEL